VRRPARAAARGRVSHRGHRQRSVAVGQERRIIAETGGAARQRPAGHRRASTSSSGRPPGDTSADTKCAPARVWWRRRARPAASPPKSLASPAQRASRCRARRQHVDHGPDRRQRTGCRLSPPRSPWCGVGAEVSPVSGRRARVRPRTPRRQRRQQFPHLPSCRDCGCDHDRPVIRRCMSISYARPVSASPPARDTLRPAIRPGLSSKTASSRRCPAPR
jgi:hypothetical protein